MLGSNGRLASRLTTRLTTSAWRPARSTRRTTTLLEAASHRVHVRLIQETVAVGVDRVETIAHRFRRFDARFNTSSRNEQGRARPKIVPTITGELCFRAGE